jgi:hypothetical protein
MPLGPDRALVEGEKNAVEKWREGNTVTAFELNDFHFSFLRGPSHAFQLRSLQRMSLLSISGEFARRQISIQLSREELPPRLGSKAREISSIFLTVTQCKLLERDAVHAKLGTRLRSLISPSLCDYSPVLIKASCAARESHRSTFPSRREGDVTSELHRPRDCRAPIPLVRSSQPAEF